MTNATVIDGTGAPARAGLTITVEGQRITAIAPDGEVAIPGGARVLDLGGKFVLPGLIDGHCHFFGFLPDAALEYMLHWGITSIRFMGDDVGYLGELQKARQTDEWLGPDLYTSALFLGESVTDLFSKKVRQITPEPYRPGEAPWARYLADTTNIASAIEAAIGCGATAVKLYDGLAPETIRQVAEEAHRQGLKVYAHSVMETATAEEIAGCGVDVMSHAIGLVAPVPFDSRVQGTRAFDPSAIGSDRFERTLRTMKQSGVLFDPTISVFIDFSPADISDSTAAEFSRQIIEATRRAHQAGIPICAGTDLIMPVKSDERPPLFKELEHLVELVGLSPLEAITAATLNNARAIGIDGTRGTVEVGKIADLVVLSKDPLESIQNLGETAFVIKDGKLVE